MNTTAAFVEGPSQQVENYSLDYLASILILDSVCHLVTLLISS
jgi:hypothetical protein